MQSDNNKVTAQSSDSSENAPGDRLDCYVVNLDRSLDRWQRIEKEFRNLQLNLIRVPAVDGKTLKFPDKRFSPFFYRLKDGKEASLGAVGCFFSHLKALQCFLDSGREFALICEDDVSPCPGLTDALTEALRHRKTWDLIRVDDARRRPVLPYAVLTPVYRLATHLSGMSNTGGYLINRKAAKKLLRVLLPMTIPYDNALYRGWIGIQEASLLPPGVKLNEESRFSNIDFQKRMKNILHPLFWTCRLERLSARMRRYLLQSVRIVRRLFYQPPRLPEE